MVFNELQKTLLGLLKTGITEFSNRSYFALPYLAKPPVSGLYIYGNVGSGKTTVMKHFFESELKSAKLFIQYQKLIKTIHQNSLHL